MPELAWRRVFIWQAGKKPLKSRYKFKTTIAMYSKEKRTTLQNKLVKSNIRKGR